MTHPRLQSCPKHMARTQTTWADDRMWSGLLAPLRLFVSPALCMGPVKDLPVSYKPAQKGCFNTLQAEARIDPARAANSFEACL